LRPYQLQFPSVLTLHLSPTAAAAAARTIDELAIFVVVWLHSASELDILTRPEGEINPVTEIRRLTSDKGAIIHGSLATANTTANFAVFHAVIKVLVFVTTNGNGGRNLEHPVTNRQSPFKKSAP
jgi:hypothetical protein